MKESFDINRLFLDAQKIYGQTKDKFYVSSEHFKGLHLGVYPERLPYMFSEYVFGNMDDMTKLAKSYLNENIFKSFYCNLCSLEEVANCSTITSCGTYKVVKNPALQINKKVTYNGIRFLISGTLPQYYYSHLLLSTIEHYSTYAVFEDEKLFTGVCKISEAIAQQNNDAKLIFNGNFGSDRWHFHTHITRQKIEFVDFTVENVNSSINQNRNFQLGMVRFKMLGSSNLNDLYKEMNSYAWLIYSSEFMDDQNYISLIFRTKIINGSPYYMIFMIAGHKKQFVTVDNVDYYIILPSASLNIGTVNIPPTKKTLVKIVSEFEKLGVYYNWDKTQQNRPLPIMSQSVESFEKVYRKKCVNLRPVQSAIEDIFRNTEKCIIRGCKSNTEEIRIFAVYKYIISFIFLCLCYERRGKNIKFIVETVYKYILTNETFLSHSLKASVRYLTNTYNIKSSANLFRGPFASYILHKSFNNFNLLTSQNISTGGLSIETKDVNKWINFYRKKQIGNPSASGAIFQTFVRTDDSADIDFIIKAGKNPMERTRKEFLLEFSVGMKLNETRKYIPNFVLTLGGFECLSDPTINLLCQVPRGEIPTKMQFIMQEHIVGVSFTDYIRMPQVSIPLIFSVLAQVSVSLLYAQKNNHFTHYDLHSGNIMLAKNVEFGSSPFLYKYKIDNEIYDIPAYVNSIIIDFGNSHVDGISDYNMHEGKIAYDMTSDRFSPNADVYTLIMNVFLTYLIYRNDEEKFDLFYNPDNMLAKLVNTLFLAYKDIFIPYPFLYIRNNIQRVYDIPDYNLQHEALKMLFNETRLDRKYYMYLPSNQPPPNIGIFKNMKNLSRFLTDLWVDAKTTNTYQWGEFSNIGCMEPPVQIDKSEHIKNVRNLFL